MILIYGWIVRVLHVLTLLLSLSDDCIGRFFLISRASRAFPVPIPFRTVRSPFPHHFRGCVPRSLVPFSRALTENCLRSEGAWTHFRAVRVLRHRVFGGGSADEGRVADDKKNCLHSERVLTHHRALRVLRHRVVIGGSC